MPARPAADVATKRRRVNVPMQTPPIRTVGSRSEGECIIERMSSRSALVVLALIAIVVSGCNQDTRASAAPPAPVTPARTVRVVPATQESVPRTVVVSGTLAAEEQVVLGVKVAGRLAELAVDLGSRVRKGQDVARIDPGDYRLRVERANPAVQKGGRATRF